MIIKAIVGSTVTVGSMEKPETTVVAVAREPWWRWVLIGVVMCSLVGSLATRTFRLTIPHGVAVKSGDAQAIRQHMNRDAALWTPPVPLFSTFQAPSFYPRVAPAGPPLGVLLLDESLYNRPPPSC
jgi:hypothetical protein